jgi:hypothetical protein
VVDLNKSERILDNKEHVDLGGCCVIVKKTNIIRQTKHSGKEI